MTEVTSMRFHLNLTAQEFEAFYRGSAKYVQAYSLEGLSIRFPGNILRPYLSHAGVQGLFEISFDEQNKFAGLKRITT